MLFRHTYVDYELFSAFEEHYVEFCMPNSSTEFQEHFIPERFPYVCHFFLGFRIITAFFLLCVSSMANHS